MILSQGDWWGKIDRPSMIYGFYEQEVLESLTSNKGKYKTLIDVGAADGYYAIGGIISGTFEKAICYEIAKEGQDQIKKNADLNKVSKKHLKHLTQTAIHFCLDGRDLASRDIFKRMTS